MGFNLSPVYTRTDILNNHMVLLEGLDRKREEMKLWDLGYTEKNVANIRKMNANLEYEIWDWGKRGFFFFLIAVPAAYGNSQARGQIRAVATGLHHSQSSTRTEPHLWLTAAVWGSISSLTNWGRLDIEPTSSGTLCWVLYPLSHNENSWKEILNVL